MITSSTQQGSYNVFETSPMNVAFFVWPKVAENFEEIKKFEELRNDVGDRLFNSLSDQDKKFILETEGIIDLGHKFTEKDFKRVEKSLREDYEY